MIYYIDCEFNSFGGELISLALAPKDESLPYFYEVCPYDHMDIHPWVEENVIPVLYKKPKSHRLKVGHDLSCFLMENAVNNEITIIADWPEDIRYFCDILIKEPGVVWPMPNLRLIVDRTNLVNTAAYSMVPHNALEDAKALARNDVTVR